MKKIILVRGFTPSRKSEFVSNLEQNNKDYTIIRYTDFFLKDQTISNEDLELKDIYYSISYSISVSPKSNFIIHAPFYTIESIRKALVAIPQFQIVKLVSLKKSLPDQFHELKSKIVTDGYGRSIELP